MLCWGTWGVDSICLGVSMAPMRPHHLEPRTRQQRATSQRSADPKSFQVLRSIRRFEPWPPIWVSRTKSRNKNGYLLASYVTAGCGIEVGSRIGRFCDA